MSGSATPFSVVICTRNRAQLVARSIASVFDQAYPRDRFELVVVDNGSTDATATVVAQCLARAPVPASAHAEPRPGVSAARNRGTAIARYEHVVFLDDDAAAAPGWLAAYDAAIASHDAAVVGGRVDPVIADGVPAPPWWSETDIRGLFGLDHAGPVGGRAVARIQWPLWLGGGNCVYTKTVLRKHGGFRTDMGPNGRSRRVAEDIDLNIRLERAGVPIYYAHDAVIHHLVTADRLTPRRICERAYWAGRTDAAARAVVTGQASRMPVSRLLRAAIGSVGKPGRTLAMCRLAYDTGYLLQSRSAGPGRGRA